MSSSFVRIRAALGLTALAAALGTSAVPLAAQATGTIRGKVVEAGSQRPLNGVQVVVDGTTRGGLTNAAGEYTIASVPAGSHTVRASMVGFTSSAQTITLAGNATATADFTLSQSAISLDALVVTGTPGATTKRAVGAAVANIAAAEVTEKAPVTDVSQLLQARTPGLTLIQPSGSAGTSTNIRIRGAGSLNASNQPIFIIDGVRMTAGGQGGYSVSGQSTSALSAINPADIESIEVIKGPAAATLYGADAAAGVVQIITKKGRTGQQKLEWNLKAEYGQQKWATEIDDRYTLCTPNRITGTGEKGKTGYIPAPLSGEVGAYVGCAGMDPNAPIDSRIISGNNLRDDPQALRTGVSRNTTLSARGGGENYSFYLSGDADKNEGIFRNNYFDRIGGRANFFVSPTSKTDVRVTLNYAQTETGLPNNDNSSWGMLRNTYRAQPGRQYNYAVGYANLSPEIINGYDNVTRTERTILSLQGGYQPYSWFRNQVTVGLDRNARRSTLFFRRDLTGKAPYGADNANGFIGQYTPNNYNWTAEYVGTVKKDVSDNLALNTSFGAQYNHYQFRSYEATGENLTSDKLNLVSAAAITKGFESFNETKSFGVYVQEQAGWKDRLFVTGTLRFDDNSTFGKDYKAAIYPNAQVSYVISEEPFWNVSWVDNLKLRAAWGRAGKAPSAYQADRTYGAYASVNADNTITPAFLSNTYGNPNLKAEEVAEIETGFEASLFGGKAGVDVTYYNKTTNDAIIAVPVAPSSGFSGSRLTNVGSINNQGVEVSLYGTPVSKPNFAWDTRLGLSANKNELTSWGGARSTYMAAGYRGAQRHDVGYPLGGFWGISPTTNPDGTLVRNSAGNLIYTDTAYIGSSVPTREAGFTNTFTLFKNLSLYSFLDYKGGHYQFNMTEMTAHMDGLTRLQMYQTNAADSLKAEIYRSGYATAPFFSKADFLKLRELSLTYTVPTSLTKRFGTNRLSVSVAGRNLATWTKYQGPDPEVNIEGDATFTRADYMSVPATRQWTTMINVSF
jgi:TonB-linked SusC/RagA family outer membrane protein